MSAEGINIHRIKLGQIGRFDEGDEQVLLNKQLADAIPKLESLLIAGKIKPMEWEIVGNGFESVGDSVKIFDSGKLGGKKGLVKLSL
jgi:hypothetical protein